MTAGDGEIDTPDAPGDDVDRGLAVDPGLGAISNEDWLRGHLALLASGDIPPEELAYLYDPDRDPATVTADDLTPGRDPAEPEEV